MLPRATSIVLASLLFGVGVSLTGQEKSGPDKKPASKSYVLKAARDQVPQFP